MACKYVNDGHLHDLGSQVSIAYNGVILIVNLKVLIMTNSHTFISLGFFFFSILSYYLIVFLMSKHQSFYNFNHFSMMFTSLEFYLSTMFLLILCFFFDKGVDQFCK